MCCYCEAINITLILIVAHICVCMCVCVCSHHRSRVGTEEILCPEVFRPLRFSVLWLHVDGR